MARSDLEKNKEIIIDFRTSFKSLSEEKKTEIVDSINSISPNTISRNAFNILQATQTVKDNLGPNERLTNQKIKNQLAEDQKKNESVLLDRDEDIYLKEKFISMFRKEIATAQNLATLIDENTNSLNLSGMNVVSDFFKTFGFNIMPERTSIQNYRQNLGIGLLHELYAQSPEDFEEAFQCEQNLIVLAVKCILRVIIQVNIIIITIDNDKFKYL
jgi:hypothetical protein